MSSPCFIIADFTGVNFRCINVYIPFIEWSSICAEALSARCRMRSMTWVRQCCHCVRKCSPSQVCSNMLQIFGDWQRMFPIIVFAVQLLRSKVCRCASRCTIKEINTTKKWRQGKLEGRPAQARTNDCCCFCVFFIKNINRHKQKKNYTGIFPVPVTELTQFCHIVFLCNTLCNNFITATISN